MKITRIHKIHLKYDCINGSNVNGVREIIWFSTGLTSTPGQILYEEPRNKLFEKINKSDLSHITFYLEDDDHKLVDFNGETICLLVI